MPCPSPDRLQQLAHADLDVEVRGALLDHAAGCAACHAAVDAVLSVTAGRSAGEPAERPVERMGRYQLGRVLGRGAMGVVYAARDPELAREVAIKVLRGGASAERLRREAQALAKLVDPNVVRVYDVGEVDGQAFVAMELVAGANLRQWLTTPRAPAEILDVLLAAGRGLVAAHAAGLIHRDFKPDNVLIADDGRVLVSDFGLARSADPPPSVETTSAPGDHAIATALTMTATGALIGTPAYMAPEQIAGEASTLSDQFAFAVTAWEALLGRRPFGGATLAELTANVSRTAPRRPAGRDVPARVETALRRALAPDPDRRFGSMCELLIALRPAPPRARRRWLVGLLPVAAVGAFAAWPRADRAPAEDTCRLAGAALAPVWNPAVEADVKARRGAATSDDLTTYAKAWATARIDACRLDQRAPTTAPPAAAATAPYVACLDRARDRMQAIVTVLREPGLALARADEALASLVPLGRCRPGAASVATPAPDQASAVAHLEDTLTAVEVSLLGAAPSVDIAAATQLRAQAEALAYPPLVLRALLIEARVAGWTGDRDLAELALREASLRAEALADDLSRAQAAAELAKLIAGTRPTEATNLIAGARAALERAGGDPDVERQVLRAEIALATQQRDYRSAAKLQADLVASLELSGASLKLLSIETAALAAQWAMAGDATAWTSANARALALVRDTDDASSAAAITGPDADPMARIMVGDFEGAIRAGHVRAAILRAVPAAERSGYYYLTVAGATSQQAFAFELDGQSAEALALYHEAELAWRQPLARFSADGVTPDLVAIRSGITSAMLDQATCLLDLDRPDEALAMLRRVPPASADASEDELRQARLARRWLGLSLVAAGQPGPAIAILDPMLEAAVTDPNVKPMVRARHRFALAQALWQAGGLADRPRAAALAADAERDLAQAIVDNQGTPAMRKLPAVARALGIKVAAWRAAHVAP